MFLLWCTCEWVGSVGDKAMDLCPEDHRFESLTHQSFFYFIHLSHKFLNILKKKSEKIVDKIPWNLKITWFLITKCKTKALLVLKILETELSFSLQLHISVCINIIMVCSPKKHSWPTPKGNRVKKHFLLFIDLNFRLFWAILQWPQCSVYSYGIVARARSFS